MWKVRVPRGARPALSKDVCWGCGGRPCRTMVPLRSGTAVVRGVPQVDVAVCGACFRRVGRGGFAEVGWSAAYVLVAAVFSAVLVLVWPWAPRVISALASVFGVLGVVAVRFGVGRREGRGMVVRWVAADAHEAVLGTTLPVLRDAIERACGARVEVGRAGPVVGWWTLAGLVGGAAAVPLVVVSCAYRDVRVVNMGDAPVEVFVDGRSFGVVMGSERENPSAVRVVTVPVGERTLESRGLDGTVLDRTSARVRAGAAHLYVAQRGDRCLWIEQRGYGRASARAVRVLPLIGQGSFVTVGEGIDAWFEPNPGADPDGGWFSGGVRNAVRQGPCAAMPGVGR